MDEVESYIHNGVPVTIYYDPENLNPRTEWDHAATMVCWHTRCNLGDEQADRGYGSVAELIRKTVPEDSFVQPLWLYEHSGMTMKTTVEDNPFSDPWDSGQVGFIYITPEQVRETMGLPEDASREVLAENAKTIMDGEVQEYDSYLRGECYGFVVAKGTDDEDSCWGFLGDIDYCKNEANSMADWIAEQRREQAEREQQQRQQQLAIAFSFAL